MDSRAEGREPRNASIESRQIEYFDDSVLIYQPRFTDESRTTVRFIIELPNGNLREVEKSRADSSSKLVRDVFAQYSEDEIINFTRRAQATQEKKRAAEGRLAERQAREQAMAITFQAKVQALEIPEVKSHPNPQIARRIRRAKNPVEVAAIVGLALAQTFTLDSDSVSTPSPSLEADSRGAQDLHVEKTEM